MGLLDHLKDKAEELGKKAKDGFDTAKDKAGDLADDVNDRFDGDEEPTPAEKVAAASDHSAESVHNAAASAGDAVAAATAAAESGADPAETSPGTTSPGTTSRDTTSQETYPASQDPNARDAYDEVLDAAQKKSEKLETDPHNAL